jgi:hypothetical protein
MSETTNEQELTAALPTLTGTTSDDVPAWELVEAGRYMPRRIRGSYRGRELG